MGDWRDALGPLELLRYWRGMIEAGYEDDLRWPLRALPHACARRVRLVPRSERRAKRAANLVDGHHAT